MSLVATWLLLATVPLGAGAAPLVVSCVSSGDALGANSTFTVDLQIYGNNVGPLSAFSGRVVYDDAQVDLTGIDAIVDDGFSFDVAPDYTSQTGSGAGSYRNFAAASSSDTNPRDGRFVRLTFEKQGFAGQPDLQVVPNPDVTDALIDPDNNPIPASWVFSDACTPAIVYYSVQGDASLASEPVNVYARLDQNTQIVGGVGFSIFYDPAEMTPTGDAELVTFPPIVFDQLITTYPAPGQINIAGLVADPINSAATGYLFRVPFQTTATPPVSFDAFDVPTTLVLGDNPDVTENLITPESVPVFHIFDTELFPGDVPPADKAHVVLSVVGDALTPGSTFLVRARLANNVAAQPVGALGFALSFDPAEIQPTGSAVNVTGSPIQFEQLITTTVGVNRVNIAGLISDPANTATEGFLFEIEMQNQGVALASPDCIPLSLKLGNNPDVAPPHLVEIGPANNDIPHVFIRQDSCPIPARVLYSVSGDALTPGSVFKLQVRLADNLADQPVGALAFALAFNPAEIQPLGDAANVAGSPIQFEVLNTVAVGANRLNIAGTISDPANTTDEGFLFEIEMQNQGAVLASSDGTGVPDGLVLGDNPDVAPPTLIELGGANTAIPHIFQTEPGTPPDIAQVIYSVEGDALTPGSPFVLRARLANNVANQPVGALAFSVFFDGAQVQPTGDAVNYAGSPIQFEVLSTVVAGGRINIAGTISDPSNTDTEGFLFQIPMQNQGVLLASTDGTGIPDSLLLGDNPDVAPPTLVELNAGSSAIPHTFVREAGPVPDVAQILYTVEGDALTPGSFFLLRARIANNVGNQPVGALSFSVTYPTGSLAVTGFAQNVAGSPIQFEQLLTNPGAPGRTNISGLISDPANTSTEGGLFTLEMQVVGGPLVSSDATGIPDVLALGDNPDVTPPNLIELGGANTAIPHVFIREASTPPDVAQIRYSVDGDALTAGETFTLRARSANNVGSQPVGALAFSITFDPSEVQPVGDAINFAGSAIQFEQLTTTAIGANRLNIAGLITDPANTTTEDFLFAIEFQNAGVALTSSDATGIPDNLILADNPDVTPPHLIELGGANTAIPHVFVREAGPPPIVAEVAYSVDAPALNTGETFNLLVRLRANPDNQPVGALAFSVNYDLTELAPTGVASNVGGSPIQFEILDTTDTGTGRLNIAGAITDPANTSVLGGLFLIGFEVIGGPLASTDGTGIPDNLTVGDNPDVTPPHLIEIGGANTAIPHDFFRDVLLGSPEIVVTLGGLDEIPNGGGPVDFGSVLQGDTSPTLTFTVANLGDAPLSTSGMTVPAGYNVTEPLAASIGAGEQDDFTVELGTENVGVFAGDLSFANNDSDENPYTFSITGEVIAPFVEIEVLQGATPVPNGGGPLNLGIVPQGTTSPTLVLTVRNTGNIALTTANLVVPAGYNVTEPLAASIGAGAQDTFTIELGTDTLGVFAGDVSFENNDADENPYSFSVTGEVVEAVIEIEVADGATILVSGDSIVDFGSTPVGTAALQKVFSVRNVGNVDLTTANLTVPTGYVVAEGLSAVIGVDEEDSFTVRVPTTTEGTFGGGISFVNNDADENPFTFAVTAQITPELIPNIQVFDGANEIPNGGGPINFGSTKQGEAALVKTFRVRNSGNTTLTLTAPALPPGYALTEGLAATLAPAAEDNFTVQLPSTAAGTFAGSVNIVSNDPNDDVFAFSITGVVTPLVTVVTFDFPADEQGWTFTNPQPPFATVVGSYTGNAGPTPGPEAGALVTTTSENTNSFAFWESPMFQIDTVGNVPVREGAILIKGAIGPESLYRSTFEVYTDNAAADVAPVIRVRSSSANFQQSDVLVATSTGDGSYSPSSGATKAYVQYFSQPEGQDMFRLDFDVINVDPADSAAISMFLDRVTVESLGTSDLGTGTSVVSLSFLDNAQGFTARTAEPAITAPEIFSVTSGGLLIRGVEQARQSMYYPPAIFGYYGLETGVPFAADTLYRIRWTVNSDATNLNYTSLPVFRLRVNDSSLKFSALTNVDSVNASARVPFDGNFEQYDQWIQTPAEIAGANWIFSFDYLFVDKTVDENNTDTDDPSLAILLENLEVTAFSVPVPGR